MTIGQKFNKLINRPKNSAANEKTVRVRGQLFRTQTDKVCFDIEQKAHIVDIRDADFNES